MTRITISKWGNSAAIRLPKAVLEALGVATGKDIELKIENGRAVIAPVRAKRITLASIVAEMDRLGPENEPETVDWGPDVGSERFYENE